MALQEIVSPWDQQPQEAAEIDWGGLGGNIVTSTNFATGPIGTNQIWTESGSGTYFGEASSSGIGAGARGAGGFSAANTDVIAAGGSASFAVLLTFRLNSMWQGAAYTLFQRQGIGQTAIIYGYTAGTFELYTDGQTGSPPRGFSGIPINDLDTHTLIYSYDGSTFSGYLDGRRAFSTPLTFALPPGQPTEGRLLRSDVGNFLDATVLGHATFGQGLSDAAALALSANPWQLFQRREFIQIQEATAPVGGVALQEIVSPWDQQPQEWAEIDWGNPLARGLRRAINLNQLYPREIVENTPLTYGWNYPLGPAHLGAAGIGNRSYTDPYSNGQGISFAGWPSTGEASFVTIQHRVVGTSNNDWMLTGTDSGVQHFPWNGNVAAGPFWTTRWIDAPPPSGASFLRPSVIAVSVRSGAQRAFWDGRLFASASNAGAAVVRPTISIISNGDNTDVALYLCYMWDRALSDAEIASISANPWQLFQRREWVPFGAGGGGGVEGLAPAFAVSCAFSFAASPAIGQAGATAPAAAWGSTLSISASPGIGQIAALAPAASWLTTASLAASAAVGQSGATAPSASWLTTASLAASPAIGQLAVIAPSASWLTSATLSASPAIGQSGAVAPVASWLVTSGLSVSPAIGGFTGTAPAASLLTTVTLVASPAFGPVAGNAPAASWLITGTFAAGAETTLDFSLSRAWRRKVRRRKRRIADGFPDPWLV